MIETGLRELRYGLRALSRDKGYAATVIATLAVCIAANITIFAVVYSVLLRPLPVPESERIVLLSNRYPNAGVAESNFRGAAEYVDSLTAIGALESQALLRMNDQTLELDGIPQQILGMTATPSLMPLLRVSPRFGRNFTNAEGEPGGEQKVILSHSLAKELFHQPSSALGRNVRLGGRPFTVVGVMPADFNFINAKVRFWTPLALTADQKTKRHSNGFYHIGRLRPDATIPLVRSQVDALNHATLERFPEFKAALINAGFHTYVQPLQQMMVKDIQGALYLLWGGALVVLLIGALNVANLSVARVTARRKEIATRLALGAAGAQIARTLVIEGVILSGIGALAGGIVAALLLPALTRFGLDQFPRASEIRLDPAVMLAAAAMAVLVGVVVGLFPMAGFTRAALAHALRDDGRTGTSGRSTRRLRRMLAGAEVGLAFVLLVGAGVLLASFRNLLNVEPGFQSTGILTASTSIPASRYASNEDLRGFMTRSLESLRRIPGVASVSATSAIPLGANYSDGVILAEGHRMQPSESVVSPQNLTVTPAYFDTMKIRLLKGRMFRESDTAASLPVIIVDEKLADKFWPNSDPIGRRMYQPNDPSLRPNASTEYLTVVGVVKSVRSVDLAGAKNNNGAYYFPFEQKPRRNYTYAVRTNAEPDAAAGGVRAAIAATDPQLALFDIHSMGDRMELSLASRRTAMLLALSFACVALFLSAIGIYGVLAYLVTQRRREIGIRLALGSTAAGIVQLVLREGLFLVAAGIALGLAGAAVLQRAVSAQVYGVHPLEPAILLAVVLVLASIALAACVMPARRALRTDPMAALSE